MGIGLSDIKDNNGKSIMRAWVIYEKDLTLFSKLEGKSKYGEAGRLWQEGHFTIFISLGCEKVFGLGPICLRLTNHMLSFTSLG